MQVKPEVCIVSLCGTQKRKGRPGHLAKMSVTARPLPPSQLPPGPCNPSSGGGANLTMPSTATDAPTSGNLLVRRASLSDALSSARTTGLVRSSTQVLTRAARPNPNLHAMCWAAWFRDGVPNDEDSAAVQRSWRFGVVDMGVHGIRDGRPTVACRKLQKED